jgi:hexosaminidase
VVFDIVLPKAKKIKEIRIHTLHDPNSWIWAAQGYEISLVQIGVGNGIADGYSTEEILEVKMPKDRKTNTIHVKLYGMGTIPEGEAGAGNRPWLFLDEIEIR